MTHQETRMRLADIWEHLNECYQQWEQADDEGAEWLTYCLVRDLDECRRICESIELAGSAS
jgi:hypothetical protein